jgi:hypothetical protein
MGGVPRGRLTGLVRARPHTLGAQPIVAINADSKAAPIASILLAARALRADTGRGNLARLPQSKTGLRRYLYPL